MVISTGCTYAAKPASEEVKGVQRVCLAALLSSLPLPFTTETQSFARN
jgi:hypothetical protein